MSRIGLKPIPIPSGVKAFVRDTTVKVEGPNGKIEQTFHPDMKVELDEKARIIRVSRPSDRKEHKALHGLTRSLVANMVEGVTKGYERSLEIVGVGYNAKLQGRELLLTVGYVNPALLKIPEGLKVELPAPVKIIIKGCDKQLVGEFAARVRRVRPPEPYKGKGIKYVGEVIRRKAGKKFGSSE